MVNIRSYKLSDRARIRYICCEVANRGARIDDYFPDEEITADLLTYYYTEYEPESILVAEVDGVVIGYLTGCTDNRKYGLVFFWLILPLLLLKGVVRGTFINKKQQMMLGVMAKNWRRLAVLRKTSFNSHLGHFHIGILKEYRGKRFGKALIEEFLHYAKLNHVETIIASVHSRNVIACQFFDHLDFRINSTYPMIGINKGQEESYHAIEYVKNLL